MYSYLKCSFISLHFSTEHFSLTQLRAWQVSKWLIFLHAGHPFLTVTGHRLSCFKNSYDKVSNENTIQWKIPATNEAGVQWFTFILWQLTSHSVLVQLEAWSSSSRCNFRDFARCLRSWSVNVLWTTTPEDTLIGFRGWGWAVGFARKHPSQMSRSQTSQWWR